jgi:hypothetical protein
LSIKGLCGSFGEHFLQVVYPVLIGFGKGEFLLVPMLQGADGLAIIDAGYIPTVEYIALVDTDECFWKLVLERF